MQTICVPFCQKIPAEKPLEIGRFFSCICPQQSLRQGREGVFPGSCTLDSQPSTGLHFVPQFFLHKKNGELHQSLSKHGCKAAKTATSCQACTIVRSHEKIPTFVGRIFINFILAGFTKIWHEIHVWLKSGKINIHNPCRRGRCTTCN